MTTKKQAVNQQQKDNTLNVQSVQIGKFIASFLVPDYNEGQKLAVIDEGVLKYLKNLLPKASGHEIVRNFRDSIINLLNGDYSNDHILELAVKECKDFVAFHTAINLMEQYFDPSTKVTMDEPFNVEKPAPTVEEMFREWVRMGNDLKDAVGQHGAGYETLMQFEAFMKESHTSAHASEQYAAEVVENLKAK